MPNCSVKPSGSESLSVVALCAERELRDAIQYWFTSLSVRIFAATDGYEASRLLKTGTAALLITDRALPPWPGLDTFRELRAANPHLRIAFIDDGTRDGATLARFIGAHVVLSRPLSRQQVIETLGVPEFMPWARSC